MALEVIRGWKDFNIYTSEQQETVGYVGLTPDNRRASYVELQSGGSDVTYNTGELVRDVPVESVTATQIKNTLVAKGSRILDTDNRFATYPDNDLVGAIGRVIAGASAGDVFIVKRMLDNSRLQITRWGVPNDRNRDGWSADFNATTGITIHLPGRVAKAGGGRLRGVIQATVTVPAGQFRYGWVLQGGLGFGKGDGSIGANDALMPHATAGQIDEFSVSSYANVGSRVPELLGHAVTADAGGADEFLADFNIVNNVVSARKSDREYVFSRIDV